MLRSSQCDELIGSIDEINISEIFQSPNPLRNGTSNISDLADSIRKFGLLSPILVRIISGRFEVVAGNRRLKACKFIGLKKIPCHIVELDDKSAFEASIIENIQRKTLNFVEEAMAFRKYINEYGWGAASDLAHKLSKSSSYVSKRMRILELPEDVLQLIKQSEISVSVGEELLSVKEKVKQSKFAMIASKESIPSKELRKMIKNENHSEDISNVCIRSGFDDEYKFLKAFDKSVISLRIAMNKLASIIENTEDYWTVHEILMNHRNLLHSQIDLLIKEKRKFIRNKHFFRLNY